MQYFLIGVRYMLKVMIVDDELIVRVGFQSCINWEEYGCEIISTCESAREAITFFQKQVPDIVFTDIMMPETDGIQLVEYICTHYSGTKVVVLSCINEIEYVKKAIKLGAEDYILKLSITRNTMIELISRLIEAIEKERERKGEFELGMNERPICREEDFRLLLSVSPDCPDYERLLDKMGFVHDPLASYCSGCLLIDHLKTTMDREDTDSYTKRCGLLNIIREYFGKLPQFQLAFVGEDEIMVIFTLRDKDKLKELLPDRLRLLNHALKTHLNLTLSMGLGIRYDDRTQIPVSYQQAKKAVHFRFFDGKASFHGDQPEEKVPMLIKKDVHRNIQEAVFALDYEEVRRLTGEWFEEMAEFRRFDQIEIIRRSVLKAWIFISGNTFQETEYALDYDDSCFITEFWRVETIWDLKHCFQNALETMLDQLQANKAASPEIMGLLHYLETHVEENISLEQAASHCALGKSQFCILFKKATGITFVHYFNKLKMKKAYTMLSSGKIQVQEAADRIGIRDISYFSRLFKKYYNISPSDVKRL